MFSKSVYSWGNYGMSIMKIYIIALLSIFSTQAYASETAALKLELTVAQTLSNNVLDSIVQSFKSNRNDLSVKEFAVSSASINPIDSVTYGYIPSTNTCDVTQTASYYRTSLSATQFNPCLVADFPNKYAIQVRFRESYADGSTLSTNTSGKYLLFIAYNVNGEAISAVQTGATKAANAAIAYFVCFNPQIITSQFGTAATSDNVNQGIRVGGNIGSTTAVTQLSSEDSAYGGIASCLLSNSSNITG